MDTDEAAVGIYQHEDGILLVGTSADVQALAERFGASSQNTVKLTPDLLLATGAAFQGLSVAQAQSGRWMKLTAESAATLREAGITASTNNGLLAGVARGPAGSIVAHLRFEPAALATPAAPMVLAAAATAMALRQAAQEMTDYLKEIDAKVDQLLAETKYTEVSRLHGISLALDEATRIHDELGTVPSTTWDKIQGVSPALHIALSLALEHLRGFAEETRTVASSGGFSSVTGKITSELPFWLAALSTAITLQDRLAALELARVTATAPDELNIHRKAIELARADRLDTVWAAAHALARAVHRPDLLTSGEKLRHPRHSTKIDANVNTINAQLAVFAQHARLKNLVLVDARNRAWKTAAVEVPKAARAKTKALGARVGAARDQVVLDMAAKIEDKRRQEQPADPGSDVALRDPE
ncbi:hypothetical protein IEE92_13340 [Kocuria sp. cx-116]|uniref:hypothetical protein n=1 Tax=Kocuria sp. cx-116 TaxID=2771378 RepID=UPI001689D222|nr:hypothetical protein [Kocuria sp. cx-116]MBD2763512.1 hypothetical protein [Kocuria sp. cx-116]